MAMLNYHPAPGLGDLLPGFFVVPQNPITDTQGTTYVPRIGDILPGSLRRASESHQRLHDRAVLT